MANLRVDKITSTETFETTGSVQFDGSGDYLSVAADSALALGTGDFTIEFWVYRNKTNYNGYWEQNTVLTSGHLSIYDNADGKITVRIGSSVAIQEDNPQPLNTWGHYAITRKSGIAYFYYNGVFNFSGSATGEITPTSARIGALNYNSPAHDFNGHISNLRVIKGKALYTENFTPPTKELTVTPETVLLACQHKTDASHEKTGKTITVTGNAVANELTPGLLTDVVKSGGNSAITGSVEFDGTGDYLQITEENDFDLGADDFTIEYWYNEGNDDRTERRTLYMQDSTQQWIVGHTNDNSGRIFFQAHDSGGNIVGGSAVVSANASNPTGKRNYWRHLAVVRNGTTATIYLDGVASGSRSYGTTAIRGDQNTLYIGKDPNTTARNFRGFISNLRIVKGTALYTDNFIPPTRELKKVPGTVLLCCQDSNDPTTEATGKTITGHGDLDTDTTNENLITNGNFTTSATDGWTIVEGTGTAVLGTAQSATFGDGNHLVLTGTGGNVYLGQEFTTKIGSSYLVNCQSNGQDQSYISTSSSKNDAIITDIRNQNGNSTVGNQRFVATQTSYYVILQGGTSGGNFDTVSVYKVLTPNRASNFTPQVGNDGSVEFVGPTKINTENYFYLPTGNTESRTLNVATQATDSARGVFMGGIDSVPTQAERDVIDYITISSTGNAQDFGNLSQAKRLGAACSSATRGLTLGGFVSPVIQSEIDYITLSSKGDAQDFGDLIAARRSNGGLANSTRGMTVGSSATVNNIEYVTIATTGNAQDFGDLISTSGQSYATSSPTRGAIAGGETPSLTNTIQYVTIATTGNAFDFGDLSAPRSGIAAFSNATRGVYAGGEESPGFVNTIEYITFSTTGNALNFGDLNNTNGLRLGGSASSPTRGIYASGGNNTPVSNTCFSLIHMVTINSTGDSVDFGDITVARFQVFNGTVSSGHGGLG